MQLELNEQYGSNKDDDLLGTDQRDLLFAGNGRDHLTGGLGNDYLDGGNHEDVLNGAGNGSNGTGEVDVLLGGNRTDTFVLGDSVETYYQGGGNSDFALILDYRPNEVLQLGPDDYTVSGDLTFGGKEGTAIFAGVGEESDLVAFLVGASPDMVAI